MSTVLAPFGFRPSLHPSGSANPRAKYGLVETPPTNSLYQGMPITFNAAGKIVPAVDFTQTPDTVLPVRGVFWGIEYNDASGFNKNESYFLAGQATFNSAVSGVNNGQPYNTFVKPYIYQDVDMEFDVQANGPITKDMIGLTFDLDIATIGNFTSARTSACSLDNTPVANLGGNFIISGLAEYVDNQWGDPYTIVMVKFNTAVTTNY